MVKMKNKFTLVFLLIGLGLPVAGNCTALDTILSKYCVPKVGGDCSGPSRATYKANLSGENKCECSGCNVYYDKNSRSCKECPEGSYVNNNNSTECIPLSCGLGYYAHFEKGVSSCPSGYYKEVLYSCNK